MHLHPTAYSFAGLNVLISGGTTGIGRAAAVALARAGAHVYVFGREAAPLAETLKLGEGLPGRIAGMTADQSDAAAVDNVFRNFAAELGQLDVLINNAGVGGEDLEKETDEGIRYIVETNFCGYLYCARRALALMKKRRMGTIINVGSVNAGEMEAGGEIYTGTKAAIRAFSESLRKSLQSSGIKVCLIEPGKTGTDMTEMPPDGQRKEEAARKMLEAEDISDAICYCLSRPRQTVIASMQVLPLLDQEE